MHKILHLKKERFHFSCAHFTIFSPEKRERLHGHTYNVAASFLAPSDKFIDYNILKDEILEICKKLDESTIIPENSKHLKIEKLEKSIRIDFNDDTFLFPEKDVILLPIENTTIEEISEHIYTTLKEKTQKISKIHSVSVYSGPGQHCTIMEE